jgi:hypothetical protein
MTRLVFWGAGVGAALLVFAGWQAARVSPSEKLFEGKAKPPEAGPLCPWRQPETDLKELFPNATRYETETRVLSGLRTELAQSLGRTPTGDENALRLFRVFGENTMLGTILTRRVKGEYGAIELVLATDPNGKVSGLRLQRLREPEPIAKALQNPSWQHWFEGKNARSAALQTGEGIPEVPVEAQASARAVTEGVRSLLILLAVADDSGGRSLMVGPHH